MVVSFASKRLRSICEEETEANLELGLEAASELRRVLADLDAAASFADIPESSGWTIADPDGHREIVVNLPDGFNLMLEPGHATAPTTSDGCIDWMRVNRIRVLRITNAND